MRIGVTGVVAAVAGYLVLLAVPYPFFSWRATHGNITVYSDRPIADAIGPLLAAAESRIQKAEIHDPRLVHRIFICNDSARFLLFASYQYRVGGVNYSFLNHNVFLRAADIEHNRLIGPTGQAVPGERTLVYFLAHEMTHSLESNYLGRIAYAQLPQWKREGYADMIGRGGEFDYAAQLAAFRRGDTAMDYGRSGLYLRFQLMCEYVMKARGWSASELLRNKVDERDIEAELGGG